jgi:hypothetical protein
VQRHLIWQGFLAFIELIKPLPELDRIYIDGGFVTDNEHPKDVDIIIEYPDAATRIRLIRDNECLRTRANIKTLYKVDVLACLATALGPDMRDFFQLLRPEEAARKGLPAGTQKGILRISLR